jgi:hypothetical protein
MLVLNLKVIDEYFTDGNLDCWQFLIPENRWAVFSTMNFGHARLPGVLYDNKIYLLNYGDGNEVLDIATKTWSKWPRMPTEAGFCQVIWNQNLIVFGSTSQVSTYVIIDSLQWLCAFNFREYFEKLQNFFKINIKKLKISRVISNTFCLFPDL